MIKDTHFTKQVFCDQCKQEIPYTDTIHLYMEKKYCLFCIDKAIEKNRRLK